MDYNKKDISEFIKDLLSDTEMCPCLMIGKYVNEFKRIYKDTIERAYSLVDVRRLIEEYDMVQSVNSKYLVIEGVGYLSSVGQNSLLKFIEESKLPIILLSYNDKVSPVIMSRMKIVVKRWYPVKSLNFVRVKDALRTLDEKKQTSQMKDYEEVQFMANNCPTLYSIKQQSGDPYDHFNDRMINIMCPSNS